MQVSKTISTRFRTLPPPPFLIKDLVLNNVFCFFLAVFFFFRCICICCRSSGVKGGNAKLPTAAQNCNERGIYSSPAAELYILFKLLLFSSTLYMLFYSSPAAEHYILFKLLLLSTELYTLFYYLAIEHYILLKLLLLSTELLFYFFTLHQLNSTFFFTPHQLNCTS